MNRSLHLLRPLSASSRGLSTQVRPLSLALRPQPSQPRQLTPILQLSLLSRAYATKSSDAENQAKANPNVDEQNATSSAREEVSVATQRCRGE